MQKHHNKVPTNPFNDQFTSLIRPIKIFLPLRQDVPAGEGDYHDFVGRERLIEKLFNWLSDQKNESGSYLVTGFRGMGKTTLVNRVAERLTRKIKNQEEPWWRLFVLLPLLCCGILYAFDAHEVCWKHSIAILVLSFFAALIFNLVIWKWFVIKKWLARFRIPHHRMFSNPQTDRMARGNDYDRETKDYRNLRVSINLGHEVLQERHILGLIASNVRDEYRKFYKSNKPHLLSKTLHSVIITLLTLFTLSLGQNLIKVNELKKFSDKTELRHRPDSNPFLIIDGSHEDSWFSRSLYNVERTLWKAFRYDDDKDCSGAISHFILYVIIALIYSWLVSKIIFRIPFLSTPRRALRRLEVLTERIVATTDIETGGSASFDKSVFSFSLINQRKRKTIPIADIREIETELADIINLLKKECPSPYSASFIIVFDEMDKIDPAMMEQPKTGDLPEFTDSVKGFPDGMDSRERRRNVLKLLANIKLFISSAKAKFVFISGRELYDAYLADLSDRDFAISSIFTGVINIDSFLTPEEGQTDIRSMSEWYIANRLIPREWLWKHEWTNAKQSGVLKKEIPSLRWYYEYLIEQCDAAKDAQENQYQDINYVIGFLHTFAAYLTHISNGSPKKIYLYFEKNVHLAGDHDCLPMNDWGNICTIGEDKSHSLHGKNKQQVLFFNPIQQKTINFVYFLSDPIMGTITNELSNFGDRFLVSLSFIIDHIYKHHNRSFSWRNMEQIPDLLKMSKAPELRDSIMTVMEYLTQIHISPILIGLNEYKFHKSIDEEISLMSKMSDEASAIFNFTLDESLSVLQYNTRLLNYYRDLDKSDPISGNPEEKRQYLPIIGRIHSNLGDLHYWDEDYYAAALQYRSAINAFDMNDDQGGFMSKIRCMLKLGLSYESRHLYPNAYQIYCSIITILIDKRWIDEGIYGLSAIANFAEGWRSRRQVMIHKYWMPERDKYHEEFIPAEGINEKEYITYATNVDGTISSFARDLSKEKAKLVNRLTLFEEVRYVYQAILAKLSVLEKMGMSGITQTNIDVAESEFRMIYKTVNIKEKFIISADFFRKLAEILYYKNSLTILTQNQESFYASVNYGDYDLLAYLEDFCAYQGQRGSNPIIVKHDVKFFIHWLNTISSDNRNLPQFNYDSLPSSCTLKNVFSQLSQNLKEYMDAFERNGKIPKDIPSEAGVRERIESNVRAFLEYNVATVSTNQSERFFFKRLDYCDYHRKELRKHKLRPACYACKYYTRSLRIITDNMFEDREDVLQNNLTKSLGVLKKSFKSDLIYTNSNHIRLLGQTLDGFGNIMFSCASGDGFEGEKYRTGKGISPNIIKMLKKLGEQFSESEEKKVIREYEGILERHGSLTRLDKSILYYWDAYRFYLIDACYNEAVCSLKKIMTILVYYIEVVGYYRTGNDLKWKDESETIEAIIGDRDFKDSFIATLFQLVVRYTGYRYDHTNLAEINELKWIYSKEMRDNIDLTRLSLYPDIRSTWLRAVEIRARGLRILANNNYRDYKQTDYVSFIKEVYPLIAPKRRYETTFSEEVLGYYTKMRFNEHIMNNLMGGNWMLNKDRSDYSGTYHIEFYRKLGLFLSSDRNPERLDCLLFESDGSIKDRLNLIEYLIHDSLICITNMVKIFTPHNHLTSYSKSFVALVYNHYWEWSRHYEFLCSLYQYQECRMKGISSGEDSDERIINGILSGIREGDRNENREDLVKSMNQCAGFVTSIRENADEVRKFGPRSVRFYEQIRNDIDDISINTIFSNYTAEMALNYYQMAEEANTEGEAYQELIGSLQFLNDDLNNDTCQFNIACDRYLLNCGIISRQRQRLEKLYKDSNIYHLDNAYLKKPNKMFREPVVEPGQFKHSRFINSKY